MGWHFLYFGKCWIKKATLIAMNEWIYSTAFSKFFPKPKLHISVVTASWLAKTVRFKKLRKSFLVRAILEYVALKRDVFVGRVDHRGTSQTCPNCRSSVRKDLSVRLHECHECNYVVDRDIASGQEICNRGIETYRETPEKHSYWLSSRTVGELGSRQRTCPHVVAQGSNAQL